MSNTQKLEIEVALKIQKPGHEVFEAIVDPAKTSYYFISKSTGKMEEGKALSWQFLEFDMQFPIRIGKINRTHAFLTTSQRGIRYLANAHHRNCS